METNHYQPDPSTVDEEELDHYYDRCYFCGDHITRIDDASSITTGGEDYPAHRSCIDDAQPGPRRYGSYHPL